MRKHPSGSGQAEMFPRSTKPMIAIEENHRLVALTDKLDWTEMEMRAEVIRAGKLKNGAGRPPHLRALLGAMVLRATRYLPYRVLADQIRHYAPARYLCGLTETTWSPDHNTLHDFISLMGEEGARFINEYAVQWAVEEKLADPSLLVADTTAQEATFPYPNEMGLMAAFLTAVTAACKKGGAALKDFVGKAATKLASASEKVRAYRLFAKTKTKAEKDRMTAELAALVERVQRQLGKALQSAEAGKERPGKYARLATAKVEQLHETMKRLVPQIRYWLKTGFVATDKVISISPSCTRSCEARWGRRWSSG